MSGRSLLLFTCSLLAGARIGWTTVGRGGDDSKRGATETGREDTGVSPAKWSREDVVKAARDWKSPGFNPGQDLDALRDDLAEWTNDEVRVALEESLTSPESLLWPGQAARIALMREWFRRDFDAGLAWFDKLESEGIRQQLAPMLAHLWPVEKAEQGFAYLLANRSLFPLSAAAFQDRLINLRARSGAAAVIDALHRFQAEGLETSGSILEIPEDFDFSALLKEDVDFDGNQESRNAGAASFGQRFLWAWYQQDRERMADWLIQNKGAAALKNVWAVLPDGNHPEHQKWLAGKIDGMNAEQQDEFMASTGEIWSSNPGALKLFAEEVSDPALKEKAQAFAVASIKFGYASQTLEILEGNPDVSRRIELLESAPVSRKNSNGYGIPGLDAANEGLLRAKLAEWNASSERIDAIIARFRSES